MADIDSLQIQIKASAESATRQISNLKNAITRLGETTNTAGTRLGIFRSQLDSLSDSIAFLDVGKITNLSTSIAALKNSIKGISNATLSSLVVNLSALSDVLSGDIDIGKIANLGSALLGLGVSIRDVDATKFRKIADGLTILVEAISDDIDISKITNLGNALQTLLSGLASAPDGGLKAVRSISTLLRALSSSNLNGAPQRLQALVPALRNFIKQANKLPKVRSDLVALFNALSKISGKSWKNFQALNYQASKLPGRLSKTGLAAKGASVHMVSLTGSMTKAIVGARALIAVLKGVWNALQSGIDYYSDLIETQNVVDVAFAQNADVMNNFAENARKAYGISELTAKSIGSRFQAMATSMGLTDKAVSAANSNLTRLGKTYENFESQNGSAVDTVAEMSVSLTALAADMASFYNVDDVSEVEERLQSVFTGQTRPLMLAA